MKYAKDTRPKGVANKAAEVLVEALPWIKNITGKTVVIKYGGSAMVDEQLRADVMNDIVLLKIVGVNPVIVHGGGDVARHHVGVHEVVEQRAVDARDAAHTAQVGAGLLGHDDARVGAADAHGEVAVLVEGLHQLLVHLTH